MSTPDFLICLECETPCYNFEWEGDKLVEVLCETCGNDESDQFATPDDYETLTAGWPSRDHGPGSGTGKR